MESLSQNKVYILDCTLRDGGYINDWQFGIENAKHISQLVSSSGVDYVELGFIKDCKYEIDKIQFNDIRQVSSFSQHCKSKIAMMVETGYGYASENFPNKTETIVDLMRLAIWKRNISKSIDYAKKLISKGYDVSMQLTRIEQYSYDEFQQIVKEFSKIHPFAIYIVDTFGLLTKDELLAYAKIIDENADNEIAIGYHAHNNLQQAYCNAIALIEHQWNHKLVVDASVMGIGRGAGNLCLELIENYLHDSFGYEFSQKFLLDCAGQYIEPLYKSTQWGYSIPYFLSAKHKCNPSYVLLLEKMNASITDIDAVFSKMMQQKCGIIYDEQLCKQIFNEVRHG